MRKLLTLAFLVFYQFVVNGQTVMQNKVFEENIQSVQLYPNTGDFSDQFNPPLIPLGATNLVLEFDDLAYEPDRYAAKMIHCNADWTPSGLKPADYLSRYNEFNLNTYDYSIDTRVPYIHFTFPVPRVSRSGNYILQVYRKQDQEDIIITRKFMVYDLQVQVGAKVVPPNQTEDRREGQQIDVQVNYSNKALQDPMNNVKLVIRQNQCWDNAKVGIQPTFIRENQKLLEYRLFDGSNVFLAGNEFRFVDLRFVRTTGRNVVNIKMEDDIVFAEAGLDRDRSGNGYVEYLDLNGQYAIENRDRANNDLTGEYVLITFNLDAPELSVAPYVFGALSYWGEGSRAEMEFNPNTATYQATLLLKQGWYDYQFALKTSEGWNTKELEGSHFQTENEYDVLVYYRELGSRYDELIGYAALNANKRRF
ncbi:DUF5103 domain-containing protein [Echinicola jeungdonensis]|uniref:DUF5103 domain-containing protein n=1 Tax=Echinicola jeungdonensis TaxID=709343 RepID=A0ABV5JAR5_9BACT|nr:DUF5103 domain-containing protein [Echinicola jeungdonensis]MDN3670270.1 DUF5103 domain-containing protein [Echinicola jeungdonensis]